MREAVALGLAAVLWLVPGAAQEPTPFKVGIAAQTVNMLPNILGNGGDWA